LTRVVHPNNPNVVVYEIVIRKSKQINKHDVTDTNKREFAMEFLSSLSNH